MDDQRCSWIMISARRSSWERKSHVFFPSPRGFSNYYEMILWNRRWGSRDTGIAMLVACLPVIGWELPPGKLTLQIRKTWVIYIYTYANVLILIMMSWSQSAASRRKLYRLVLIAIDDADNTREPRPPCCAIFSIQIFLFGRGLMTMTESERHTTLNCWLRTLVILTTRRWE